MSLGRKVFASPARLWLNWPLWGGLLAMLLLAKHAWVLFAPSEHAMPSTAISAQAGQAEQLFGAVSSGTSTASLNGIRPIGIFASRKDGFAVMQTESGQVGVGLGGQVVPGVRLIETHPDYVILERNGTQLRVDLSQATVAASGITAAGTPVPAQADPGVAAQMRMLNRLSPEQRTVLQQQQQEILRGRH